MPAPLLSPTGLFALGVIARFLVCQAVVLALRGDRTEWLVRDLLILFSLTVGWVMYDLWREGSFSAKVEQVSAEFDDDDDDDDLFDDEDDDPPDCPECVKVNKALDRASELEAAHRTN